MNITKRTHIAPEGGWENNSYYGSTSHETELKISYDMPKFDGVKEYTDEYRDLFKTHCLITNAFYYGRPKEDFSVYEAKKLAKEAGATILLLDNMS